MDQNIGSFLINAMSDSPSVIKIQVSRLADGCCSIDNTESTTTPRSLTWVFVCKHNMLPMVSEDT